ncbi:unnamed protein product [Cladocopium goreaui]|uniref:Dynein heavy chain linker domain-containing protein n=1 Tax=Cladocopium goreaui TaxID=2562237 RepID=A0A9P1DD00_9DINO|nr:unnamed protein product [Cladocopium goreaui]
MQKIRVKIEGFREDVRSFRAEFLDRCPLEVGQEGICFVILQGENAATGNYDKNLVLSTEHTSLRRCPARMDSSQETLKDADDKRSHNDADN